MKVLTTVVLLLVCGITSPAQEISIIPEPWSVVWSAAKNRFVINSQTRIVVAGAAGNKAALFLQTYLTEHYGVSPSIAQHTPGASNVIILVDKDPGFDRNHARPDTSNIDGTYTLRVHENGVVLAGSTEAGLFYATQSLIQLLPVDGSLNAGIPMVKIHDFPRFAYRGLHLDVSRHFFPVSFIKKYIDYIALHKMNVFHWHLTDDQGWRIEIKKHPRLTEVGAWRNGTLVGYRGGDKTDGVRYGGFYTQKEIKEVIEYAEARCVSVIPEIEMPGHALAILTTYPQLACEGNPGPFEVAQGWGIFRDVLCAGKEEVFDLLKDVLTEVMELFPSRYIHIGGDECLKTKWEKCADCQRRIKTLTLKDEYALQSYFIKRIGKFIRKHDRIMIGWNEIAEGGLAPDAVLMSWQAYKKGDLLAAEQGNFVIQASSEHTYLNKRPVPTTDSFISRKLLILDSVYHYEPVPVDLPTDKQKFIWGGQGNVWTEYLHNGSRVEHVLFPRLSALSEVLWSMPEKKNWENFQKKLPAQFNRYVLWGASYETSFFTQRGLKPENYNIQKR